MFASISRLDLAGWFALLSIAIVMLSLIAGCKNRDEEGDTEMTEVVTAPPKPVSRPQPLLPTSVTPEPTKQDTETPQPIASAKAEPPSPVEPAEQLTPYEHYLRALEWRNRGEYEKATTEFELVIHESPKFWRAHVNLARTQIKQGKPANAVETCNKALKVGGEHADTYNVRGLGYLEQGMYSKAVADFEKAIKVNPKAAWPHNNLGLACLRTGQLSRALQAFRTATKLSPKTALMHNNYGAALEKLGHAKEAAKEFETALQLQPDYPKARTSLTRVQSLLRTTPPRIAYREASESP